MPDDNIIRFPTWARLPDDDPNDPEFDLVIDTKPCWNCKQRPRSSSPYACGMCEVCAKR